MILVYKVTLRVQVIVRLQMIISPHMNRLHLISDKCSVSNYSTAVKQLLLTVHKNKHVHTIVLFFSMYNVSRESSTIRILTK